MGFQLLNFLLFGFMRPPTLIVDVAMTTYSEEYVATIWLFSWVGDLFGVDLVGGAGWFGAAVEGADALADGLVGGGDALARA